MTAFSTLVDDCHIFHRSVDGEALPGQPNALFGHLTSWFDHCTFCDELLYPQRWSA